MRLYKCVLSRVPRLVYVYVLSIGRLGKSHKPFETNEKMKLAKQATAKKYIVTLSGSEISIVVTVIVPKDEGDCDVNN